MTTTYPSKKSALETGIFYVRGKVDISVESLKLEKTKVGNILAEKEEDFIEAEKCTIKSASGKRVELVVSPYNGEFHLWLCVGGVCLRT